MLRKVTDAECGRMISAAIDEACTSRSVGTISLERRNDGYERED